MGYKERDVREREPSLYVRSQTRLNTALSLTGKRPGNRSLFVPSPSPDFKTEITMDPWGNRRPVCLGALSHSNGSAAEPRRRESRVNTGVLELLPFVLRSRTR